MVDLDLVLESFVAWVGGCWIASSIAAKGKAVRRLRSSKSSNVYLHNWRIGQLNVLSSC